FGADLPCRHQARRREASRRWRARPQYRRRWRDAQRGARVRLRSDRTHRLAARFLPPRYRLARAQNLSLSHAGLAGIVSPRLREAPPAWQSFGIAHPPDSSLPRMTGRPGFARGPFTVPSFRFQWPADLLTSWAGEMEGIILGWYIIVETGSVVLLTFYSSPLFGVIGDRIGARNLLCLMRAAYFVFAATFMSLAFTGLLNATYALIVAGAMGLVRSSDLVMRNQLIGASMPPALLVGAASVTRTTQDSARIAGSLAGAGMFAALGMG